MQSPSFVLNNIKWGDGLLAGIGGSASQVNMLEPLDSALPVIQGEPIAFRNHLDNQDIPDISPVGIGEKVAEIFGKKVQKSVQEEIDKNIPKLPDWGTIGKYSLAAIVGLILIIFGLWILLYPTTKTLVREVAKAA